MRRTKRHDSALQLPVYALLFPLLLILLSELMWRGSIPDTAAFITGGFKQVLYGFLVLAGLSTLALLLFSHPFAPVAAVYAPFLLIAAGNAIKMAILEYPAATCNILMLYYDLPLTMIESPILLLVFIAALIAVIIISMLLFKYTRYSKFKISPVLRWLTFAITVTLVVLMLLNPLVFLKDTEDGTMKLWQENGLVGSIVLTAHKGLVEKPADEPDLPALSASSAGNKPDIVLVKLEAFTDGKDWSAVHENLTPAFERLKSESVYGSIYVNTFGGNTTSTVFDVLTGYCSAFTMPGSTGFGDYIRSKTVQKSLVWSLKDQGYATTYISSAEPHYTNERNAAEALGFDRFISIKDFPEQKGNLPDSVLTNRIITEYENMADNPVMLTAMSMENHYDYNINKYANVTYLMPSRGELTALENQILSGYLNGIHNADILIKELTDYFTGVDREVIILFFSDHRPSLGWNYGIYKKLGLVSPEITPVNMPEEDQYYLHSVPFMIWSNKGIGSEKMERISPSYLLPILFDKAGVKGNDVSDFLQYASKHEDNFGTNAYPYSKPQRELAEQYRFICYRDIVKALGLNQKT